MEQQTTLSGTQDVEIKRPVAANVGDGGQPILASESETQREEETERVITITRSGRKAKAAPRLIEAMATEIARATAMDIEGELLCYAAMFPQDDDINYDDSFLAYKAVSDPDTMYFHQAMREPDSNKFKASMIKEVDDQFENGNFTVVQIQSAERTHSSAGGLANEKKARRKNRCHQEV